MDSIIAIKNFASKVASQSGYTEEFCEKFITGMFRAIADALAANKEVAIKTLGRFYVSDTGNICFLADAALAAKINEPFSCFEPVELDDDIDIEMLSTQSESESGSLLQTATSEETKIEIEDVQLTHDTVQPDKMTKSGLNNSGEKNIDDNQPDTIAENEPELPEAEIYPEQEVVGIHEEILPDAENNSKGKGPLWFLFGLIIGICMGVGGTYYWWSHKNAKSIPPTIPYTENPANLVSSEKDTPISEEKAGEAEVIDEVNEKDITINPETEPIYETVTSTNYLAAISRRHYGTFEFWVYIYEENKDKLGHPDRIEKNTVLLIPPAEKYGIDKTNQESIARAVELSKEIYARFDK